MEIIEMLVIRLLRSFPIPLVLFLGLGTMALAMLQDEKQTPPPEFAKSDPAKINGADSCKRCHQSEWNAWKRTMHFRGLAERTKENEDPASKVREFAEKMGVGFESQTCANCHATVQTKDDGTTVQIAGVSCESCHGPSGGEEGWLRGHSDSKDVRCLMDDEIQRARRLTETRKAGMIRPRNVYALARRCFECHIIGNEKLVNVAGHPSGRRSFELSAWIDGEVRHNFAIDPKRNADAPSLLAHYEGTEPAARKRVLFVMGKLVELEMSLRHLARATPEGQNARDLAVRCLLVRNTLEKLPVPEAVRALEVLQGIFPLLSRAQNEAEALAKAAEEIGAAARAFQQNNDGTRLETLDELIAKSSPRGTVYEPETKGIQR